MAEESQAAHDAGQTRHDTGSEPGVPDKSPEKMEAVLNQGLEFMSGLLEMATGQKLNKTEEDKPMLKVDKETGEVTMKFRLPGF